MNKPKLKAVNFYSPTIVPVLSHPAHVESWSILCDFDGTISLHDVTDCLLGQFGQLGCDALEDDWKAGRIGSRACMAGQIALLNMSKAELDAQLNLIEIDPSFPSFVAVATRHGIAIKVVSDGLDYAIHHILKRYHLDYLPVEANKLVQIGDRQWQLEFPYAHSDCRPASGNCKCACVANQHHAGQKVLFIGDGSSDFCASGIADFVLAKDRLQEYCQQQGISYAAFHDFHEASNLLENILDVPIVLPTTPAIAKINTQPKRMSA